MKRARHIVVRLLLFLLVATRANAQQQQQRQPHIGYVYPAGGRQGSSIQVVVGGQLLDSVSDVRVSGTGVTGSVVEQLKPLTFVQAQQLRDQMRKLLEKRAAAFGPATRPSNASSKPTTRPQWTLADDKALAEIQKKLVTFNPKPSSPAIAETVTLKINVADDAEAGTRELRLRTARGFTNPLTFCIGQLPEFSEAPGRVAGDISAAVEQKEMAIKLPAVVNGQILSGGVNRYRFPAHRGQHLVIAAAARSLIPYISDAVPGWFQATLTLYDERGNEVAYDDDFRFHPDPALNYIVPKDGQYTVEIKDAIYRGREDFVYRMTIGEVPFITGLFPLGGKAGTKSDIELTGWNVGFSKITRDNRDQIDAVIPIAVKRAGLLSNSEPFMMDTLPESFEKEPNNSRESAQPVSLPIIINGRINHSNDVDWFRFDGHTGDKIVAEVYARRLDSPLDSVLELSDACGNRLALNDDHEDKAFGLVTHHADSWLSATLPADGTYWLCLTDAQTKGGSDYAYRLRISPPMPDFELRVVPSSINVRAGGRVAVDVYAIRTDEYAGEIALRLAHAPPGFELSGNRVPANQDHVRLTLAAPVTARTDLVNLRLEGCATLGDKEITHAAAPADDMMQAFIYHHLVTAQELLVMVFGRSMPASGVALLDDTPLKLPCGGSAEFRIGMVQSTLRGPIQLELNDPPDGITLRSVRRVPNGAVIVVQCDSARLKPGIKGNLILDAFIQRTPTTQQSKAINRRISLGVLPAIPFEVVSNDATTRPEGVVNAK